MSAARAQKTRARVSQAARLTARHAARRERSCRSRLSWRARVSAPRLCGPPGPLAPFLRSLLGIRLAPLSPAQPGAVAPGGGPRKTARRRSPKDHKMPAAAPATPTRRVWRSPRPLRRALPPVPGAGSPRRTEKPARRSRAATPRTHTRVRRRARDAPHLPCSSQPLSSRRHRHARRLRPHGGSAPAVNRPASPRFRPRAAAAAARL